MLIATIPLSADTLNVPADVLDRAHVPEVDLCARDVPMGADVWITCSSAWPHTDSDLEGKLLLTLSIVSTHQIGDARSFEPMMDVRAGYLFVVDPMVRHWLGPALPDRSEPDQPWVGLQWVVDLASAKRKARSIVKQFGGTWLDSADKRYSDWKTRKTRR